MKKREYYYLYDILCHEYINGGVISCDEEAYATSVEELKQGIREDWESSYEFDLDDIDEWGGFEILVKYTDDPNVKLND